MSQSAIDQVAAQLPEGRTVSRPGAVLEVKVIPIPQALREAISRSLRSDACCDCCNGTGREFVEVMNFSTYRTCETCGGTGKVRDEEAMVYEQYLSPIHRYQHPRDIPRSAEPLTKDDIEGPFFKVGSPFRSNERLAAPGIVIMGNVLGNGKPIFAMLDVWQANEKGEYDNEGWNLCGKFLSEGGHYRIETVRPGNYQIGPDDWRPAHVHVKLAATGFAPLTTQLYFPDDPHNEKDRWFHPSLLLRDVGDGGFSFNFNLALED